MDRKWEEEFRYYEMPVGRYDLALLGEKWVATYCTKVQHFHNYFEVGYCHYGSGIVFLGNKSQPYEAGTISLIPSNFSHGVHSADGSVCFWEFLYLDIFGFLDKCYQADPYEKKKVVQDLLNFPVLVSSREHPRLFHAVSAIFDENRVERERSKEAVLGYMYVLVQELICLNENVSLRQFGDLSNMQKLRPALLYVEQNYHKTIRIKDLAQISHISETYFRKLFADCMHISPLEYINYVRIVKACAYMQKEDLPVSTLAWKTGFSSVATFERNFKKIMGETPKQWKLKEKPEKSFVGRNTKVLKGW